MNKLKELKITIGNVTIGDKWEIANTKIYNDDDVMIENGKSIRTIYIINDEKNYTEWVYCPSNYIEKASDLINKYIKRFLYTEDSLPENDTEKEVVKKVFTEQEINDFLSSKFKNIKSDNDNIIRYESDELSFDYHIKEKSIIISNMNGKVINHLKHEEYTLGDIEKYIKEYEKDPAEVNSLLMSKGYTDITKKTDDGIEFWVYKNPKKETFVLHSEENNFFALVSKENDILESLESDNYNIENINNILN